MYVSSMECQVVVEEKLICNGKQQHIVNVNFSDVFVIRPSLLDPNALPFPFAEWLVILSKFG